MVVGGLFVDVESQVISRYTFAIYFAAIDIETEISLEIESKYVPGSNAFDPKEKVEGKVSKRLSDFDEPPKKVGPKVTHPYFL